MLTSRDVAPEEFEEFENLLAQHRFSPREILCPRRIGSVTRDVDDRFAGERPSRVVQFVTLQRHHAVRERSLKKGSEAPEVDVVLPRKLLWGDAQLEVAGIGGNIFHQAPMVDASQLEEQAYWLGA